MWLPVGNVGPPSPPSSSAGSRNSSWTSAAGKATPSSWKSPSSCTSPSLIGTWFTILFLMLACQMLTVAVPSAGASTRPMLMANGPTAALRLPQLPDQSTSGLSMATWPNR